MSPLRRPLSAEVVAIDPRAPDPAVLARAAALLQQGQLVAMPTETVYGLAASALDPDAVRRIFEAKGRPAFNPLIVHIADLDDLPRVARDVPLVAIRLAERFWPGPLTLVLPRQPWIPDLVTAGLSSVGVRLPASPVARGLIRAAGVPLAAPSANRSTAVSPTTAQHVVMSLGDRLPMILDAGPCQVGIESTVLDCTQSPPVLLRPGGTSRTDIEAMIGPITTGDEIRGDTPRPSPGLLERHYAPRAQVTLFPASERAQWEQRAREERAAGARVALVLRGVAPDEGDLVAMPDDAIAYARALYGMLHGLDSAGFERAYIERPPQTPEWVAVHDRLRRASTP